MRVESKTLESECTNSIVYKKIYTQDDKPIDFRYYNSRRPLRDYELVLIHKYFNTVSRICLLNFHIRIVNIQSFPIYFLLPIGNYDF